MPLLRLLGFARLGCGCLVGRYREMVVDRSVDYVEEKGCACTCHDHQRNEQVPGPALAATPDAYGAVAHAS